MEEKKSTCRTCKKDVPDWNMELDPIWECYDCMDTREITDKEAEQCLKTALSRIVSITDTLNNLKAI